MKIFFYSVDPPTVQSHWFTILILHILKTSSGFLLSVRTSHLLDAGSVDDNALCIYFMHVK